MRVTEAVKQAAEQERDDPETPDEPDEDAGAREIVEFVTRVVTRTLDLVGVF